MATTKKVKGRMRRHRRVRKKVLGTTERPRLAVYRSNRHIYAQVIDDIEGKTLVAASTLAGSTGDDPLARAKAVGEDLAKKAKDSGITKVTFDRGGFLYHGQVRRLAEGAREGGLEF